MVVYESGHLHSKIAELLATRGGGGGSGGGTGAGPGGGTGPGGTGAGREVVADGRLPAGWNEGEGAVPVWVDLRIPARLQPFWFDGDWGRWPSRSEALYAVAAALHAMQLSPLQVLRAMFENEQCLAVAMTDTRRPEGGNSAAQWLWAYCVRPLILSSRQCWNASLLLF